MQEAKLHNVRTESTVSVAEAAQRIHVTPDTIHAWRKRGHILAVQLPNKRYLIPLSEIDRLTTRPEGAEL